MAMSLGLCLLTGCTEPIDKPDPPDTRALFAAYRMPAGELSDASGQKALTALDEKVAGLSTFCGLSDAADVICEQVDRTCGGCAGLSPIFEVFDALRGGETEGDAGAPGSAIEDAVQGDGYVRVTRICPGHGDEPSPDPAHGKIELVVNVSEQGFDSVVFGSLEKCQLKVLGSPQTIDAAISLTFGESWGFSGFDRLRPVISLAGTLATELGTQDLNTDLELGLGGESSLALLLDSIEDAPLVFFQDARGSGFRAKNGEFLCNFAEGRCESGEQSVSLR